MMPLLLDTSGYSFFKNNHAEAVNVIRHSQLILFPVIALGELYAGFERGTQQQRNHQELNTFLASSRVKVVETVMASAERYGSIQVYLRNAGIPIPTNDIWIAAIAMQHGATVLTANKHFQRMPQIMVHLLAR